MKYRFRLTFHHYRDGLFRFSENSLLLNMDDGTELTLVARDANNLESATRFHFDAGGFPNEQKARESGEKLRTRLRVLNSILGLGMTVPILDGNSGQLSDDIKQKAKEDGAVIIDGIVGLSVYPDDGNHFESVVTGKANVYPSDPSYVLKALQEIWNLDMRYDDQANDALEILSLASRELSPKPKFLTTYLALEPLIEIKPRSQAAQLLIDTFVEKVKTASLKEEDATSLIGALGHLKEQSFSSAFSRFAQKIEQPKEISGMPIREFVSKCISVRNKIAHKALFEENYDLDKLTKGLREMVLGIIWTRNHIPTISIQVPTDRIDFEKFEVKLM